MFEIYNRLINLTGVDSFKDTKIPMTEHQLNLMEKYENPYIMWLQEYVLKHYEIGEDKEYDVLNSELRRSFLQYLKETGRVKFEITTTQFGYELKTNLYSKYMGIRKKLNQAYSTSIINFKMLVDELDLSELLGSR